MSHFHKAVSTSNCPFLILNRPGASKQSPLGCISRPGLAFTTKHIFTHTPLHSHAFHLETSIQTHVHTNKRTYKHTHTRSRWSFVNTKNVISLIKYNLYLILFPQYISSYQTLSRFIVNKSEMLSVAGPTCAN